MRIVSKKTSCEQVQKEVFWLSREPFLGKPFNMGCLYFCFSLTLLLRLGSDLSRADRNFLVVKSDIWEYRSFEDMLVHGKYNSQIENILRLRRSLGCRHLKFLAEPYLGQLSAHRLCPQLEEPSSST